MIVKNESILRLFKGPGNCQYCGRWCNRLEAHHATCRGIGGANRLDIIENLLAVGSVWDCGCHDRITRGDIKPATVWLRIARREGKSVEWIMERVRAILRAPKGSKLDEIQIERMS